MCRTSRLDLHWNAITTVCRLGWQYRYTEFWPEREPAFQGWGINPVPKHDCFLALLWLYFKIPRKLIFKSLWCTWTSHRKKVKLPKWTVLSFSALAWSCSTHLPGMWNVKVQYPARDALNSLWNGQPDTPSGEVPDLFCRSCWLWDSNQKRGTLFPVKSANYHILFISPSSQNL